MNWESLDEDSYVYLEGEYDTLDIKNLTFWKNALGASVTT